MASARCLFPHREREGGGGGGRKRERGGRRDREREGGGGQRTLGSVCVCVCGGGGGCRCVCVCVWGGVLAMELHTKTVFKKRDNCRDMGEGCVDRPTVKRCWRRSGGEAVGGGHECLCPFSS